LTGDCSVPPQVVTEHTSCNKAQLDLAGAFNDG
jgi:hypothetical protein